ncbi:DNA/RNA non-specific endonuclease [Coleofasciculus sp. FACHB-501]|nr:DNA/RNA non-specific endonuclease [Coleofasciculus sp. FACHB-501]
MNLARLTTFAATLVLLLLLQGCPSKEPSSTTPIPTPSAPTATPNSSPSSTSIHLRLGNPSNAISSVANPDNYLMVKPQYALSYNKSKGTANWASWHLNQSWLGNTDRQDNFRPDPTLPTGWEKVTPTMYSGSGYDRGHIVPSADRTRSVEDNAATFVMTNMMPQTPDNNRNTWGDLEEYSRELVRRGKELYIIAGPFGTQKQPLKGKVVIPSSTWKIIVVLDRPGAGISDITANTRLIGVNIPNQDAIDNDWRRYRVSVDVIEKLTGYNFLSNVNPSIQKVIESKVDSETSSVNSEPTTQRPLNLESPTPTITAQAGQCSPAYPDVCIPPAPPDLNCDDIEFKNFQVLPPDPHNFDGRDNDGFGCER